MTARPTASYSIEALERRHDRAAFSCGNSDIDRYLREQASQEARRYVAGTFVAVEEGAAIVAGYYSLSATSLDAGELPSDVVAKLPRYPMLPATLLGRLAVDQRHQGRGLGEQLLVDALARSLAHSDEIGSIAVVVEAIDEAAQQFYEHFEFIPLPDQVRRLFIPMRSLAKLYGQGARRAGHTGRARKGI